MTPRLWTSAVSRGVGANLDVGVLEGGAQLWVSSPRRKTCELRASEEEWERVRYHRLW